LSVRAPRTCRCSARPHPRHPPHPLDERGGVGRRGLALEIHPDLRPLAELVDRLAEVGGEQPEGAQAASESEIRRIALTATRPARTQVAQRLAEEKPNTPQPSSLDQAAALQAERAPLQRAASGLWWSRTALWCPRPDVLDDVEDLGRHALVETAGGLVRDEQERLASDGPGQCRALGLALRELGG